jgi:hypothetical protein
MVYLNKSKSNSRLRNPSPITRVKQLRMTQAQHSAEIRSAFKISVRKHVRINHKGNINSKRSDNNKTDLKQIGLQCSD